VTTISLAPTASSLLTAADRCDRCGAAARVLAVLNNGGELLFCGHHGREHRSGLERIAVYVEDHTASGGAPAP
jgi:hypothetical protein